MCPSYNVFPSSQTISGTNLFVCNLGPTGGAKGYEAITGNPPDDMSVVWWINNLLLPEIYVERGKTYWFRVQVNYATIAAKAEPIQALTLVPTTNMKQELFSKTS